MAARRRPARLVCGMSIDPEVKLSGPTVRAGTLAIMSRARGPAPSGHSAARSAVERLPLERLRRGAAHQRAEPFDFALEGGCALRVGAVGNSLTRQSARRADRRRVRAPATCPANFAPVVRALPPHILCRRRDSEVESGPHACAFPRLVRERQYGSDPSAAQYRCRNEGINSRAGRALRNSAPPVK